MHRKTRNAKFVKKKTKKNNFVMCRWMFET